MQDADIENVMRQYRPVGPPAELRTRIVSSWPVHRTWPWTVAAAALLLATVVLHGATARLTTKTGVQTDPEPAIRAVEDLAEMFGGDAAAQRLAEFIIVDQQTGAEHGRADVEPTSFFYGDPR